MLLSMELLKDVVEHLFLHTIKIPNMQKQWITMKQIIFYQ